MPADAVVVTSVGMVSAVGLNSWQTAAAIRAGVARFKEQPWMNRAKEPFMVACLPDDALPPLLPEVEETPDLSRREGRLLRLADVAMQETMEGIAAWNQPVPLILGLSEVETGLPLNTDRLLKLLKVQCDPRIEPPASKVLRCGRAAALFALKEAMTLVQSGKVPMALAGGLDSYRDLHVLGTLDRDERIESAEVLDGFIPGEGAGFLVLTTEKTAQQRGLSILARILGVQTGFEEGHRASDKPYKGEGLAQVFQELFKEVGSLPPVRDVYSSMNGENYWGKEWGVGYLRSSKSFDGDQLRITHPADCYGDPGAACGALLAILATRNLQQGRAASPVLVYASSDRGERAALLLEKL